MAILAPVPTVLTLLLLGCPAAPVVQDTADTPSVAPQDTAVTSWMPTYVPAQVPAVWDADQAVDALVDTLAIGFPGPFGMMDTFLYLLSQGRDNCPGSDTFLGPDALEGCAAGEWYFLGIGGFRFVEDRSSTPVRQALFMLGDLQIRGPELNLDVGGHWDHLLSHTDEVEVADFEGVLTGTWLAPLSESEPWLAAGTSAWIAYWGTYDRVQGVTPALRLSGGLSLGGQPLDFQDLSWGDPGCQDQPAGVLSWQDPGLGWWRVDLSDCSGCGGLSHDGVAWPDPVCVDLAPFAQQAGPRFAP